MQNYTSSTPSIISSTLKSIHHDQKMEKYAKHLTTSTTENLLFTSSTPFSLRSHNMKDFSHFKMTKLSQFCDMIILGKKGVKIH